MLTFPHQTKDIQGQPYLFVKIKKIINSCTPLISKIILNPTKKKPLWCASGAEPLEPSRGRPLLFNSQSFETHSMANPRVATPGLSPTNYLLATKPELLQTHFSTPSTSKHEHKHFPIRNKRELTTSRPLWTGREFPLSIKIRWNRQCLETLHQKIRSILIIDGWYWLSDLKLNVLVCHRRSFTVDVWIILLKMLD